MCSSCSSICNDKKNKPPRNPLKEQKPLKVQIILEAAQRALVGVNVGDYEAFHTQLLTARRV